VRTPWPTKVRREWRALTGGPVSFSWWLVRALGRVVFAVAVFGVFGLVYFEPPMLADVLAGTASPLSLLPWALTTPTLVGFLAVVAVVAFVLPFLPDRDPHDA
jgi:Na+-translocating ferredoxin:NAD+ oxidoreductase RnfD subunit